jgi:hypothetical protein
MSVPMQKTKQAKSLFPAPAISDEKAADRLAEGYRQSFDESLLITWEEMAQRIDRLFERKRGQSA